MKGTNFKRTLKNRILFLLFFLQFSAISHSQPIADWLQGFGGTRSQSTEHITNDSQGNIYVYGRFNASLTLPPFQFNAANGDAFLLRYNSNRTIGWVKQLKNISLKGIKAVDEKILLYGEFNDTARIANKTYISEGLADGIIISLSQEGEILKELIIKGAEAEFVSGLAVDDLSNIFAAATVFNGSSAGTVTFQSNNSSMAILKLNANMEMVWHQHIKQTTEFVMAKSISCSSDGSAINILGMAGSGSTHGINDSISFSNSTLSYKFVNTYGYFIAALNGDGEAQTVTGFYGMNHYFVESIAQDREHNVYLSGSSYYSGYHITKYSQDLNLVWQKNIGFHPESWFYTMKVNEDGDIYTMGSFYENIDFGDYSVTNNLKGTLFLAKHDKNGDLKWTVTGSGNNSTVTSLSLGEAGDLYATGYFNGTLLFQNKHAASAGEDDFFIAGLKEDILNTITETTSKTLIAVYPNPTQGKLIFNSANDFKVNVYSVNGSKVFHTENSREIDICHLPVGTYFVELINGETRHVSRIILK